MGIQFFLGLRAKRNRGSNPGDSDHSGPVRENTVGTVASSGWRRKKEGRSEFTLQAAFDF